METTLTNSLFRFITFRGPELVQPGSTTQTLIEHPNLSDSAIYNDVTGGETLAQAIAGFSPLSLTALKALSPALYDFAHWLAQNASELTVTEINAHTGITALNSTQLTNIWENLFYQIETQADLYTKDRLIELIVADRLIRNRATDAQYTTDQYREMAGARVVIPKALFGTGFAPLQEEAHAPATYKASRRMTRALDLLIDQDRIAQYARAAEELKKAEAAYEKSEAASYRLALSTHQEAVQAFIAERMEDWNPTDEYRDSLPYTEAELPAFSYTPAPEMDMELLASKLPAESLFALQEAGLDSSTSFSDVLKGLDQHAREATARLFEGSSFSRESIFAAGVEIPVKEDLEAASRALYGSAARLYPVAEGLYKLALVLDTAGTAQDILAAKITYGDTVYGNKQVAVHPMGDQLGLVLFPEGFPIAGDDPALPLGLELTLPQGLVISNARTFTTEEQANDSVFEPYIAPDQPAATGTAPKPAPAKYGIHKLGIADYRRVEQTICCYVPGEVSHIENIMAREYKERNTRQLRRSEDTTTTEQQTERENLKDTTSTDRYEMQQEVATVLDESKSQALSAGVNAGYSGGGYNLGINASASYANNTNKNTSDRQALTFAQEVTMKASEKVIRKVREERVSKIIEEYEERNTHGFDNRGDGAENISGVYRWVDKVYKNQIVNYGKRLMYEFLIPEPAAFHKQALSNIPMGAVTLSMPVDPKKAAANAIADHRRLNGTNYAYWAAQYNVEVAAPPAASMVIGKSFSYNGHTTNTWEGYDAKEDLAIPQGYYTDAACLALTALHDGSSINNERHGITVMAGESILYSGIELTYSVNIMSPGSANPWTAISAFEQSIPVSVSAMNFSTVNATVNVRLKCTPALYEQWQVETFNKINAAYEKKLAAYNDAYEAARKKSDDARSTNPLFYRQIENTVLKKNCISYLVGQNFLGKSFVSGAGTSGVYTLPSRQMDDYAAVARFMEEAFEWNIMSYAFYPFYWSGQSGWNANYLFENDDPLFRAFIQSGMARVVVTVTPGFEEAVLFYIATGKVWNGGAMPVVDDALFKSISEEFAKDLGKDTTIEDTWTTKVPTSLTVIQNSTVGLDAEGLPCDDDCEDPNLFTFSSDHKLVRLKKEDE